MTKDQLNKLRADVSALQDQVGKLLDQERLVNNTPNVYRLYYIYQDLQKTRRDFVEDTRWSLTNEQA